MGNTLYLECCAGISGDMTVAALLDLGADRERLMQGIESLKLKGYQIKISNVMKSGIRACDFNVILEQDNHDHDMEYLHGQQGAPCDESVENDAETQEHHHGHENYQQEHHHSHENHRQDGHTLNGSHHHTHRNLQDILAIIDGAEITLRAKQIATDIFQILAKAEAKAHDVPLEKVHFHEVGAVDSIIDVVAAAICLDLLEIENVIVPQLNEGSGFVRCQHGMLPVPVPAVANIVAAHHLNLHRTDIAGELVTPTGAAIVAAIKTSDELPEKFSIQKIGIGAGKRNYEIPSMLRAMLIEDKTPTERDCIYKLESNIDDCSGEQLGYVMERLMEAGARDVHYIPVFMKKNRPAYQLNVLCHSEQMEALEQIIFAETTTIGIRRVKMERSILKRRIETVQTELGEAKVKVCELPSGTRAYPEYESVVELCKKNNMTFHEVFRQIESECMKI